MELKERGGTILCGHVVNSVDILMAIGVSNDSPFSLTHNTKTYGRMVFFTV
jgi:hypothetical protein